MKTSQLAAPALQAAESCQLPSARREGEAGPALLHPWGGAGREMQTSGDKSVCNGKRRDSSSDGGQSLTPVMSCAVMSVLGLWLHCLMSGCILRKGLKSCTAHFRDLGMKFGSLCTHYIALNTQRYRHFCRG